jgi:uncharacterized protein with von Willebrand factor type A (vWA) domain
MPDSEIHATEIQAAEIQATDAGRVVVGFARVVRSRGLDVPVGATVAFGEALARVGVRRRERVYWAARATLVRRPEDVDAFDEAFDAFWLGHFRATATTCRRCRSRSRTTRPIPNLDRRRPTRRGSPTTRA